MTQAEFALYCVMKAIARAMKSAKSLLSPETQQALTKVKQLVEADYNKAVEASYQKRKADLEKKGLVS